MSSRPRAGSTATGSCAAEASSRCGRRGSRAAPAVRRGGASSAVSRGARAEVDAGGPPRRPPAPRGDVRRRTRGTPAATSPTPPGAPANPPRARARLSLLRAVLRRRERARAPPLLAEARRPVPGVSSTPFLHVALCTRRARLRRTTRAPGWSTGRRGHDGRGRRRAVVAQIVVPSGWDQHAAARGERKGSAAELRCRNLRRRRSRASPTRREADGRNDERV